MEDRTLTITSGMTNCATIHVNPLVAMTIKDRYVSVTRLAKGK